MTDSDSSGPENRETTVAAALDRYLRSLDAGGSENTLRWTLRDGDRSFLAFCRSEDIGHVGGLDTDTMRDWSFELRSRTTSGDIASSTAHNYFAYVRAFLSFCVRDGLLQRNPATPDRAREFLPEDTGERDQQFWSERDRDALLRFATKRADEAHNDDTAVSVERAYRDRALVVLLALTGVRGAEVFRDPHDDRREGLRWRDVDFDARLFEVLGKSREREAVGLTSESSGRLPATAPPLERWKRVQDPPTDDWPVFPSGHGPSRKRALVEAVGEDRADELTSDRSLGQALREAEVPPPSISKNGARNLMRRLCDEADLDIDGEYLKPHGGRRGLGHALYSRGEAVAAQQVLRHSSIETTHESYADLQAREVAESAANLLSDSDDTD